METLLAPLDPLASRVDREDESLQGQGSIGTDQVSTRNPEIYRDSATR
jgi:hypothetical protein